MRFSLNKLGGRRAAADRGQTLNAEQLLPLECLRPGEWAEVADVSGEPGWVARMGELGLRAGGRLRVLQPGSPCLLVVGGARLILRADVASQVLVRPLAAFACPPAR